MSKQAVDLLEAFDSLPADDKQTFAVEILRRTRDLPFDSGPLTDEEIGDAGKALFGFLTRTRMQSAPKLVVSIANART